MQPGNTSSCPGEAEWRACLVALRWAWRQHLAWLAGGCVHSSERGIEVYERHFTVGCRLQGSGRGERHSMQPSLPPLPCPRSAGAAAEPPSAVSSACQSPEGEREACPGLLTTERPHPQLPSSDAPPPAGPPQSAAPWCPQQPVPLANTSRASLETTPPNPLTFIMLVSRVSDGSGELSEGRGVKEGSGPAPPHGCFSCPCT